MVKVRLLSDRFVNIRFPAWKKSVFQKKKKLTKCSYTHQNQGNYRPARWNKRIFLSTANPSKILKLQETFQAIWTVCLQSQMRYTTLKCRMKTLSQPSTTSFVRHWGQKKGKIWSWSSFQVWSDSWTDQPRADSLGKMYKTSNLLVQEAWKSMPSLLALHRLIWKSKLKSLSKTSLKSYLRTIKSLRPNPLLDWKKVETAKKSNIKMLLTIKSSLPKQLNWNKRQKKKK